MILSNGGIHQPDKGHATPDSTKFGAAEEGIGQGQSAFSRQC